MTLQLYFGIYLEVTVDVVMHFSSEILVNIGNSVALEKNADGDDLKRSLESLVCSVNACHMHPRGPVVILPQPTSLKTLTRKLRRHHLGFFLPLLNATFKS